MRANASLAIAMLLIVHVVAIGNLLPTARADVMPPTSRTETNSGMPYCIAQNVTMPIAEVDIGILITNPSTGLWQYDVNVSCSFVISSDIAQNLTTAFVYPTAWLYDFTPYETDIDIIDFDITVNQSSTPFEIKSYTQFDSEYTLNETEWHYLEECTFATINLTTEANSTHLIDVDTSFNTLSNAYDFDMRYIVGTARSWKGNTHETVRISIKNEADILSYSFYPNGHLQQTGDNETAEATWEFDIADFESNSVVFTVHQREYPDYHHVQPPPDFIGLTALAAIVVTVGIFVFVFTMRNFRTH